MNYPIVITMLGLFWANQLQAVNLKVIIDNSKGEKVKDAVVFAAPKSETNFIKAALPEKVIDQKDKEFIPYVSVVQSGTKVVFPNHDKIRHHVYSFSDAKQFEIPLYKGIPAEPILFDRPGVVTIGCNIHDWMMAYNFVTETPYYAITDKTGETTVNLPAGEYDIKVWHPNLRGSPDKTSQSSFITEQSAEQSVNFTIQQKKVWKAWRGGNVFSQGY